MYFRQTFPLAGMRVLILDNFDSFTYNLYHYLGQLTDDVTVKRNNEIALADFEEYSHILISPGPSLPAEAGITFDFLKQYFSHKPILGVCLGCQALAEHSGGKLYNQQFVAHGLKRPVKRTTADSWLLSGLKDEFEVGLYHSWAIDENSLSDEWKVCAKSNTNVIMAIEHRRLPVAGVQFHPESIMSESGLEILSNWLNFKN